MRKPGRPRASAGAKFAAVVGLLALAVAPLASSSGVSATHLLAQQMPPDASPPSAAPSESSTPATAKRSVAATSSPTPRPRPKPKPKSKPSAVTLPAVQTDGLGIPLLVLQAYHRAADRLSSEQPSCRLPWWLLAGIGHTESGHAEGGRLFPDGTTRGRILGPVLNGGIAGDAVVQDTDHGLLDGDRVYDRAVGPMQFIPSTWQRWAADGNGDGKRDPSNIFDATLAAGRYLCAGGRDLGTVPGLEAAILSYNHSQPYLQNVLAWGHGYRDGAIPVPGQVAPVVVNVVRVRPPLTSRPTPRTKPTHPAVSAPTAGPTKSSHAPAGPTPSGSPSGSSSAPPVSGPGCSTTPSTTPSTTLPSTTSSASPTTTATPSGTPATSSATPSATTTPPVTPSCP
jgi:membrane-bound lytic murein transglycosylase B